MLVRMRRQASQWLVSGGYLLLLFAGADIGTPQGWRWVAALLAGLALIAWLAAWSRLRAVADLPTSRIATAAQGYVELLGRGGSAEEPPLQAPLKGGACLWYRYSIQRKQGDSWVTDSQGESEAPFLIDDGSGTCRVYPCAAEVLARQNQTWHEGDYRYTLARLDPGETIYVLGAFSTTSGATMELVEDAALRDLLAEWKYDKERLHARFDLDGDGTLDLHEWELARAQARREIRAEHAALRALPESHSIGAPDDGRLFLISSLPPARILGRFRLWSLLHVAIFLAALAGQAYLWPR